MRKEITNPSPSRGFDAAQISSNLRCGEAGIWFSKDSRSVSYPDQRRDSCFEIEDSSFWYRHRNRVIVNTLGAWPPRGMLMEIGGGNGSVSAAIEKAGYTALLLEPGIQGIRNAQSRGLTRLVCSRFEDAGIRAQSIPAVGLFDVLEHVCDQSSFLTRIADVLAPQGRLYGTVPAYPFLWSQHDKKVGHFRRYTALSLNRALKKAGLQIEHLTYFFALLVFPILCLRTLPNLVGLGRNQPATQKFDAHLPRRVWVNRVIHAYLRAEYAWLARGRRLPLGTSILVVASRR